MILRETKSLIAFEILITEYLLVAMPPQRAFRALSFLHSQLIVILFTAIPGAHSRTLVGLLFVFLLCLRCDAYLLKFCCFAFAFLTFFALNALFKLVGEQNFFIRGTVIFSVCRFICLACAQLSQRNVLVTATVTAAGMMVAYPRDDTLFNFRHIFAYAQDAADE